MLKLLHCLCSKYPERIKGYLVQYKAPLIMKKLYNKFADEDIKLRALKIIKAQVKYMPRRWRETNMKIITAIYDKVKLSVQDDWLMWEGWSPQEDKGLTQDEIRNYNNEFNARHYSSVEEARPAKPSGGPNPESWISSEYNKIQLDPEFCKNYEKWLEDNVWGYYD